jgi:hypothetical protein
MAEDDRANPRDGLPEPTIVVLPPVLLPLDAERERRAVELLAELLADVLGQSPSSTGGDPARPLK